MKIITFGAHCMCLPCFVYVESDGPKVSLVQSFFVNVHIHTQSVRSDGVSGGKVGSTYN
ncbi:hypothetical protein PHAVU_006G182600 [Phaseolus vulgaris]|uniref:Uncharacterized protein n=1 Tax=Phaseolus vulgaris TaxID=3885 RepID=V7BQ57_PHAVU|nr:hypothetical protein PHAVU_006G182600g [Phaseolus vulgaris]ESW20119.1 hypothetical protein PHAVU_006G182600g [Phaseolus vulgaris]